MSEADTCRLLITPRLQAAGWDSDPHSIAEQRTFTEGRIIVRGDRATRRPGKRADYLLRYTRDFPLAVVEAKAENEAAATGMQQAKEYAEILGLKFAYAQAHRPRLEGAGEGTAGQRLQPRSQKPGRQRRHHPPPARGTRRQHPRQGKTHRGNHGEDPETARKMRVQGGFRENEFGLFKGTQ
jgi:hypothetical protein